MEDRPVSRAGARRGQRPPRRIQPRLVGLGMGALVGLAAWGLLVWAAIGFGRDARAGEGIAWLWLVLVALVAVGCLFAALMLVVAVLRGVGILAPRAPHRH